MDHLAFSASAVGTTTYTEQSVSNFPQDVSKHTYTTAGTIYKPSNAQPLQPPVRRGRTLKWPPPGGPTSELSLFPKSVLAGFPLKSQGVYTTASPLPNPVPKYSPLQQNYDRAISPATDHSPESLYEQEIESQAASRVSSVNLTNMVSSPDTAAPASVVTDKHVDAEASDEENDDNHGDDPLRGLPVKSLHNLASYPNPNQKRAQKALQCARAGVTPASSAGTAVSRSATPASGGLPILREVTVQAQDGPHSPDLFRSARIDPTNIRRLHVEPKQSRDLSGSWRSGPGGVPPPPGFSNAQAQRGEQAGGYKSTLATGPGAPLPLTAGPPGQRQYRTSTFESTIKALNNGLQVDISGEKPFNPRPGPPALNSSNNSNSNSNRNSNINNTNDIGFGTIAQSRPSTPEHMMTISQLVRDSVPSPPNRGGDAPPKNKHGADIITLSRQRLALEPGTSRIANEQLVWRQQEIDRKFYAGVGDLGQPLESVIKEADDRKFKRCIGVIGDRRPKSKPGMVTYPHMSADDIKNMTDKEAAEPLLTMAFASVLKNREASIERGAIYSWKCPERSQVDFSEKGRQSAFGNTGDTEGGSP